VEVPPGWKLCGGAPNTYNNILYVEVFNTKRESTKNYNFGLSIKCSKAFRDSSHDLRFVCRRRRFVCRCPRFYQTIYLSGSLVAVCDIENRHQRPRHVMCRSDTSRDEVAGSDVEIASGYMPRDVICPATKR